MYSGHNRTLADSLARVTHELKSEAALQRMRLTLFGLVRALAEQKYRPDQPRAPKGTPEGRQWIDDPRTERRPRSVIDVAVDCAICGKRHIMKLTPLPWCKECLIKEFGGMKIHEIQGMLEPDEDEDPDK